MNKYIIVSPVRNEEDYLDLTIKSVLNQTVKPMEYILVNDGSTDKTPNIIDRYVSKYSWIKRVDRGDRGHYLPGAGVVHTFYEGLAQTTIDNWDFVVKLDGDLEFEPDYFEKLFLEFEKNPKLGIASGCTYLPVNNRLIQEQTLKDHPKGASKVYRKQCWEDIGGMKPVPGWDLADLLNAQMKEWVTVCFFELKLIHHRLTGSRRKGIFGPKFLQGRFEYRHGYNFGYTFLKAAKDVVSKPFIIGSLAKISGYLYAFIRKDEFIFDDETRKYLRKKHQNLLLNKIGIKTN